MSNLISYKVALDLVTELRPLVDAIKIHDSHLADQMKRAATSVLLNLAEGQRRVAGNKRRAFEIAHGEAREVLGCLDCAAAWVTWRMHCRHAQHSIDCSHCAGD